jgi:nicotinamidase-related amidase
MKETSPKPFVESRRHTGEPQQNLTGENANLHCETALLVIDVINDLDFEGNEFISKESEKIAHKIIKLKKECKDRDIPIIYCNDNWSKWKSDMSSIIAHCTEEGHAGTAMSRLLVPDDGEYIVLKPKHSAFYSTTLEVLLQHLQVKTLILTGVAGNICVLFTANDAYMRDFSVIVPRDCIASNSEKENESALTLMESVLKATTTESEKIDWCKICNKCNNKN